MPQCARRRRLPNSAGRSHHLTLRPVGRRVLRISQCSSFSCLPPPRPVLRCMRLFCRSPRFFRRSLDAKMMSCRQRGHDNLPQSSRRLSHDDSLLPPTCATGKCFLTTACPPRRSHAYLQHPQNFKGHRSAGPLRLPVTHRRDGGRPGVVRPHDGRSP